MTNFNNQSPQQLAELLARKCADVLHNQYTEEWYSGLGPQSKSTLSHLFEIAQENRNLIRTQILQSIPLVELLECAASLYKIRGHGLNCECHSCIAQNHLNLKLTQILEGETKK